MSPSLSDLSKKSDQIKHTPLFYFALFGYSGSRDLMCLTLRSSCLIVADALAENSPTHAGVMMLLNEDGPNPLTFILNANLLVNVKIVTCK